MEKVLRQADPLFPSLFLLVAKALQVSIIEVIIQIFLKGFPSRSRCFEKASGLKINLSKSVLYGVGLDLSMVEEVANLINFSYGENLFCYLGLHDGRNMANLESWKEVVDRFLSKLSSWKSKLLFIGGRFTLCKSVLGSLLLYFLSLFFAPLKVLEQLESTRSPFFLDFMMKKTK